MGIGRGIIQRGTLALCGVHQHCAWLALLFRQQGGCSSPACALPPCTESRRWPRSGTAHPAGRRPHPPAPPPHSRTRGSGTMPAACFGTQAPRQPLNHILVSCMQARIALAHVVQAACSTLLAWLTSNRWAGACCGQRELAVRARLVQGAPVVLNIAAQREGLVAPLVRLADYLHDHRPGYLQGARLAC